MYWYITSGTIFIFLVVMVARDKSKADKRGVDSMQLIKKGWRNGKLAKKSSGAQR